MKKRSNVKLHALALACALSGLGVAQAQIVGTGEVGLNNGAPLGPGDTIQPEAWLFIAGNTAGQVSVGGGNTLEVGVLYFGGQPAFDGRMHVHGAGSRVLVSTPVGDTNGRRLTLGDAGNARLLIEAGGVFDARQSPGRCPLLSNSTGNCGAVIGVSAGTFAEMVVRGPGSRAEFASWFDVGRAFVRQDPGGLFGIPGGVTTARIEVADGALLRTDRASVGFGPSGPSTLGSERTFSSVVVTGANSVWNVAGGSVDNVTSSISTAFHANATVNLRVADGGRIDLSQVPNTTHFINLSSGAGRTDMQVTGAGSAVNLNAGVLQVGRGLNGVARLDVTAGGVVNDAYYVATGRGGSNGRTVIDGLGSRITVNRAAVPGSADALSGFTGAFDIGRDGGIGQVDVSNGGRIEVIAGAAATERSRTLRLGVGEASQGTLNLHGAQSLLLMTAASAVPGGGPGEAFNPYLSVGYQGVGTLNVTGGAQIEMFGAAVSTAADSRSTGLIVGGRDDTNAGGQGFVTISGAGSELGVRGSDAIVWVGRGPGSSGQMTVRDGALVTATNLLVGRNGGAVGVMTVDRATVFLQGQQTGGALAGAGAAIGSGVGSTGVLNLSNAALLSISNPGGTEAVSFNVGGSRTANGGDGVLQMSGGSRIQLAGPTADASVVTIGREGAAFARLRGGSSIDAGAGTLYVGRFSGGDGTLIVSEGSSITAGWVGVGRNRTDTGHEDGGTGTFILNGGTLTATDVVIGTNGFLGGSAGSIVVSGSITNYGIFSPGSSPGRFDISGGYVAGAGSRLVLEVLADGQGGYLTDQVFFGSGSALDLAALTVEFRFLGGTDPNAFQASGGFDLDTFLRRQIDAGGSTGLDDALFAQTRFTARADSYAFSSFTFDAVTGASFVAVAVPEPGTWAMWLVGLGLGAAAVRRRRCSTPTVG